MKVIYRISDKGNQKVRPPYVTPCNCFLHFINIFKGCDVRVIADNVEDTTYNFLLSYVEKDKIIRTSLLNGGSFIFAVNYAIANFADDEKIYFAEDDYIYTKDAPQIIEEGLTIADYSSGYDHPDKYHNHDEGGPNPFISGGGEQTRVVITQSSHWKFTNSCCMTFATTVKILKEDNEQYMKYCGGKYCGDFALFCDLLQTKQRKLVSCIPSVSTHGESFYLAKFIDWDKEFQQSLE